MEMRLNKLLLLVSILLFLIGCNNSNTENESANSDKVENVVNIYTQRHYPSDEVLYEKFEEKTGIKVKSVKASADQLLERISMEGENSPADLLISVDAGRMWRAKEKGIFQPITDDKLLKQIDPVYIDKEYYWVGIAARGRVFVVNKDSVGNLDLLKTYNGITSDQFKGEVLVRTSENLYNQSLLAAMIAHDGEEAALEWAQGVVYNMARKPKGNDTDQLKAVAAGVGDVCIVNTYYLARLMASDQEEEKEVAKHLALVFPDQGSFGAHVNISGAGLLKYSKNKENALELLRFLTSPEAQKLIMEMNNEYPVNPSVEWTPVLKEIGTFQKDTLDLNLLGKYNSAAVKVLDKAGWQ